MKKKMTNLELACYSFAEKYGKTRYFGQQILTNLYNNGVFNLEDARTLPICELSTTIKISAKRTALFIDHLNNIYENIQKEQEKNHDEQTN